MSFSYEVKGELSKCSTHSACCNKAELYGILMYGGIFESSKIKLTTENVFVARRIQTLFKKVFEAHVMPVEKVTSQKSRFVFEIKEKHEIKTIFEAFGYDLKKVPLYLNFAIFEEPCCKISFLRGAFLTGGLISNPEKRYSLEISSKHYYLTNQLLSIMYEADFLPKKNKRKNSYIVYMKDSVAIEEFLAYIGASSAAISVMQIKVEKELRNEINRKTNCDEANITKTVAAASKQINAIKRLKESGKFEDLPSELKYTAEVRLNNPELTLSELQQLLEPAISRPGLSHRLNRLIRLAGKDNNK